LSNEIINNILIIDVYGRILKPRTKITNQQTTIDISELGSGIYSLIVYESGNKYVKKFLKL
ncbi:MAG: T9SS type A sorting domain-containing protein, partial [Bacteroidota bacterium]|nr:T9SS type A sorting domain-containing protein [Bacteroidota bacterium]